jgi:hypothetical protein
MRITMSTKQKLNSVEALDAISYQLAVAEAKDGKSSPDDERWSRELGEQLKARLAEMRRNLLPAATVESAKPISPSLLLLGRDALIAKISAITQSMGGALQYAHRDLSGLTDDDLRRLLDLIESSLHSHTAV